MTSSGTQLFDPPFSDMTLEAYGRLQLRPASLVRQHFWDSQMSANLLMSEWAVRGQPLSFKLSMLAIPLVQGVAAYALPRNIIATLDWFVRTYDLGQTVNQSPQFTTVTSSPSVSVYQPNHGMAPGYQMAIVIPVAVGGLLLQNFYQVQSVTDANNYVIEATALATSSTTGGAVPIFTTTAQSTTVKVTLPNHGLQANQSFSVQASTLVGGLTLIGYYTVAVVIDSNNFTIISQFVAGANDVESENGGLCQLQNQTANAQPQDYVITPIGRTDYANQPEKMQQSRPTTVWWDRLINGRAYMWPVPDQNGPYTLMIYVMQQTDDVVITNGTTLDLPWRFLEAFAAGLAYKLAFKYPPPMQSGVSLQDLRMEKEMTWELANNNDAELNVPLYLSPEMSGYYR